MTNHAPISLQQLFRYWRALPHQAAAISELETQLESDGYDATMRRDQPWFHTWSQAGKQSDDEWLPVALKIIKEFEGCRLEAYQDAVSVWTIGWGTVQLIDRPVQEGDRITQAEADALLTNDVEIRYRQLVGLLPMIQQWPANRVAALVSWSYNVGMGAVMSSTLRQRLMAGDDPVLVASEELPRWNKAGDKPLAGLTRRRAAEVALFVGQELQQPPGNPLQVPWYAQMDSADRAMAARMCFSSSCAMLLQYLKPGTLSGPNGDDQYLKRVLTYGDTIDPKAQIRALSSFGVRSTFTQKAGWDDIERQINAGIPVPCGFLHRGTSSAPDGGGHWLIVVGFTTTHLVVHDPFGEADLVNGKTLGGVARFAKYSRKNFGPRWMVEGPGSGWAIIAER